MQPEREEKRNRMRGKIERIGHGHPVIFFMQTQHFLCLKCHVTFSDKLQEKNLFHTMRKGHLSGSAGTESPDLSIEVFSIMGVMHWNKTHHINS